MVTMDHANGPSCRAMRWPHSPASVGRSFVLLICLLIGLACEQQRAPTDGAGPAGADTVPLLQTEDWGERVTWLVYGSVGEESHFQAVRFIPRSSSAVPETRRNVVSDPSGVWQAFLTGPDDHGELWVINTGSKEVLQIDLGPDIASADSLEFSGQRDPVVLYAEGQLADRMTRLASFRIYYVDLTNMKVIAALPGYLGMGPGDREE